MPVPAFPDLPRAAITLILLAVAAPHAHPQTFAPPTANSALMEPGGEPRFFAPTPGRTWNAGAFGCVRSEGTQMHEGIDILATRRDKRGEPVDEVLAAAAGEVAYVNRRPGLSNYGNYLVLRHRIEGLEVFTLYAHLASIRTELRPGTAVRRGERVGIMGRTTNTRTSIGKDRAHVHFEIDLLVNERFADWLRREEPSARNDHGPWNGRNLAGLDPAAILRLQATLGPRFSLLDHVRNQRPLARVLVADTSFPWLRRYPSLIRRNPTAQREGIVAYELSLNFNGVPYQAIPRARSEIQGAVSTRLLWVDAEENRRHPCRGLVFQRGQSWTLTARGRAWLQLLTF